MARRLGRDPRGPHPAVLRQSHAHLRRPRQAHDPRHHRLRREGRVREGRRRTHLPAAQPLVRHPRQGLPVGSCRAETRRRLRRGEEGGGVPKEIRPGVMVPRRRRGREAEDVKRHRARAARRRRRRVGSPLRRCRRKKRGGRRWSRRRRGLHAGGREPVLDARRTSTHE